MTKADKPGIEELADELTFWNTYRESRRAQRIDVDQFFAEWATEQEQGLTSPGAREDFAELRKDGCLPLVLAAMVALLRQTCSELLVSSGVLQC
jgi:hypothetical protein